MFRSLEIVIKVVRPHGGPAFPLARVGGPGAPGPSGAPLYGRERSLGRNPTRPAARHLQGSPGQMAHTCSNTNAEPLGTSAAVCASQTATGSQPGTAVARRARRPLRHAVAQAGRVVVALSVWTNLATPVRTRVSAG